MTDSASASSWHYRLAQRLVTLWWLKALGTTGFMFAFFWAYFAVLHNPLTQPVVMPVTWLDRQIGFSALAFPAYVSLWVYVSLPPALLPNLRRLLHFGAWISVMCLFCLAIFWAFPTSAPHFEVDLVAHPEFGVIRGLDAPNNAFPSLHVASAVFTAVWLHRLFAELRLPGVLTWLSAAQCSAIIWSTIATRQHVALDVAGGILVGVVFAWLSLRGQHSRTA